MADAGRVIRQLKAQLGEALGENAILVVELEETRDALARAEIQLQEAGLRPQPTADQEPALQ